MTAAHAFTIGKAESPRCSCGAEKETVFHLVFECALRTPCPVELLPWKDKEPCYSHALLWPTLHLKRRLHTMETPVLSRRVSYLC